MWGSMKKNTRTRHMGVLLAIVVSALSISASFYGCEQATATAPPAENPQVAAADPISAGRYIIKIAGCNDCHTPGFMQNPKVPESEWLTGVPIGWRGPWGTSYATNLRIAIQPYPTADSWVAMMKTREGRPPMPWSTLHSMSETDLRAVYLYIKSLGPKGEMVPMALPPDVEPKGPYLDLTPKNLPAPR